MPRVPDDMRRMAAMLGEEIASYPGVTSRPMFGSVGYYRDGVIFAALPKTRALYSATSFIFKLNRAPKRVLERARGDERMTVSTKGMQGWHSFEIASDRDMAAAQQWLIEAWRWARKRKASTL